MSLRELVDPECGGANPLMRLGTHLTNDIAHKDDGISGHSLNATTSARPQHAFGDLSESQLVDEYLGQMSAPPPQSFRMDRLLQEMREIDAANCGTEVIQAPLVSAELNSWADEFGGGMVNAEAQPKFDANQASLMTEQVRISHSNIIGCGSFSSNFFFVE